MNPNFAVAPLVLTFLLASPAAQAGRVSVAEQPVSDASIVGALTLASMRDDVISADALQVQVEDGVVWLRGEVPHLLARDRALELARRVEGARAVVDELRLWPGERSDAAIRSDIVGAWALEPALETHQLRLEVTGGRVRLSGAVESHEERREAERLAASVPGVRRIDNAVAFVGVASRADREIADDVRVALAASLPLRDAALRAEVRDGVVALHGTVFGDADRLLALSLARVDGVASVVDGLQVHDPADGDGLRADPVRPLSDAALVQAVRAALRVDPRVVGDAVEVRARDGIVRLSGVVETRAAQRAAVADAWNVLGTLGVESELHVRGAVALDGVSARR